MIDKKELIDALKIIKKHCEGKQTCSGCVLVEDCERLEILTLINHPDLENVSQ